MGDLGDGIGRARLRDADSWKDEKRTRPEERRVKHARNVAQVVTGAVAGGRLARTLRRDARRRSIFDHPLLHLFLFILLLLLYSSLFPAPCNPQPTRRQATLPASELQPAIATTTRAADGGVLLAIRGVPREGRVRHGREGLMDAQEEGKNCQWDGQSRDIKKGNSNWG